MSYAWEKEKPAEYAKAAIQALAALNVATTLK